MRVADNFSLLSIQMLLKLQRHLEVKIQGDIWENEIRSRLARPLSATTFCERDEQLCHPLAARKYIDVGDPATTCQFSDGIQLCDGITNRFPYSTEAHEFARRIRRCYRTYRFRIDVSEALRRLAIAIRVLRRRGVPLIIKGFRRRRRAAVAIQRRFRRYMGWKERVLRPFVAQQVALWIAQGSLVARARIIIADGVTRLFLMRRERREAVERRAQHLRRWSAKTRVCLFVHQVWVVWWLRRKREENVTQMWKEMQALEAIEKNVHAEYKVLLATSFGKSLLKKDLASWRTSVRTPALGVDTQSDGGIGTTDGESDQFVRLKQCFQIFDLDQSGSLDLDEFELMLTYLRGKPSRKPGRRISEAHRRAMPLRLTTAQIRNLFDDLDVDGNGTVTYKELEKWWQTHTATKTSASLSSASSSYLSGGLDRLLLQSHGLLFWLLGRKQMLEKKFVKKLMVKRAQDAAKRAHILEQLTTAAGDRPVVFRCSICARAFGLRRDMNEHTRGGGGVGCSDAASIVVDLFVLKKWIHEEEFRLLDE